MLVSVYICVYLEINQSFGIVLHLQNTMDRFTTKMILNRTVEYDTKLIMKMKHKRMMFRLIMIIILIPSQVCGHFHVKVDIHKRNRMTMI